MKTTSLVFIGALAFAIPALAVAQQQRDPQRPETREQPAERQQMDRQQMDRQYQPKPAGQADSITRLEPNHISLGALKGADVVSQAGEKVGAVEDLVIDETGRVAAIVVRTGAVMGLGGKKVALPWHMTSITAGAAAEGKDKEKDKGKHHLHVGMNADELNDLPEFEDKAASAEKPRN
ncbi:MAG TPA: PRC-barrel domain-containing protein [Gammaproteobacteria bacterium]|nr:PRC-barrel domain-containing protein [Gammaproteobacteria bacterium]